MSEIFFNGFGVQYLKPEHKETRERHSAYAGAIEFVNIKPIIAKGTIFFEFFNKSIFFISFYTIISLNFFLINNLIIFFYFFQ
tara:strand:- start:12059 stop:12307 length:249 start_codon:yes stop_codon:yes gene_type:complete